MIDPVQRLNLAYADLVKVAEEITQHGWADFTQIDALEDAIMQIKHWYKQINENLLHQVQVEVRKHDSQSL